MQDDTAGQGEPPEGRDDDYEIDEPLAAEPDETPPRSRPRARQVPTSRDLVVDSVLTKPLLDLMRRKGPVDVLIEVATAYEGGADDAAALVAAHLRELPRVDASVRVCGGYVAARLTAAQIKALVRWDTDESDSPPPETAATSRGKGRTVVPDARRGASRAPRHAIYRIWPNFEVRPLITRSITTTKCLAAQRAFDATGQGVVWGVLDSGIDKKHKHFELHENLRSDLHRSFVSEKKGDALVDEFGHGTHVAGIIAGEQREHGLRAATWFKDEKNSISSQPVSFDVISGMAPATQLVSLKVLNADGSGDVAALIAALLYVQEVNGNGDHIRIHGLNISVGHPFDPGWFATGLTPVCREVNRLVKSGVVVVVAAGNTGYGYARDQGGNPIRLGFDMTIQDPGNADLAITVGSTSSSPHSTGISFFSSKGPTGDGRMKPDLVAPGERVISAAAGALARKATADAPGATYVEDTGTSMSAPHVSGAAAAFLSVHQEFKGQAEKVKKTLMESATDLGRSPNFQGAGLVDAMRAIQSV